MANVLHWPFYSHYFAANLLHYVVDTIYIGHYLPCDESLLWLSYVPNFVYSLSGESVNILRVAILSSRCMLNTNAESMYQWQENKLTCFLLFVNWNYRYDQNTLSSIYYQGKQSWSPQYRGLCEHLEIVGEFSLPFSSSVLEPNLNLKSTKLYINRSKGS